MRTSLPEIRQTAPTAALKRRDSLPDRLWGQITRSSRYLGEAECVDQTFLDNSQAMPLITITQSTHPSAGRRHIA